MMDRANESSTIDPGERRPVGSRQWRLIQAIGAWLAERGVSPNAVSCSSIFFSAVGAALIAGASSVGETLFRLMCLGAVVCIQLRLLANVLDGIVAERSDQASLSGRLFNEWPDRISDCLLLGALGWLIIDPQWRWLGGATACIAVMTAYVRELGRAVDAPPSFQGPLAKPQRMALLAFILLIMAAWPAAGRVPFWGSSQSLGLPAAACFVFILGGIVTIIRRLRAIHRFANHHTEQR